MKILKEDIYNCFLQYKYNYYYIFSHPSFYSKVDEHTGFVTRNILCFPIKDTHGIFFIIVKKNIIL